MKKGIIEFQMMGYQWPRTFYEPVFEPDVKPDNVETISWQPVVKTNSSGNARILFRKPSIEGNLRIIVEGISYEGQAGFADVVLENELPSELTGSLEAWSQ